MGWLCLREGLERGGSTRSAGILELSPPRHEQDVWGNLVQPQQGMEVEMVGSGEVEEMDTRVEGGKQGR